MVIMIFALIALIILMISFIWTNLVGAPWVPTSMGLVHTMLKLADVGPDDVVYDLGCGDGRTVITAARRYGARAVGVEIDPLRYVWCQMMISILGLRDRVEIIYGNFFQKDLSGADVVTCYLLQSTNNKLQAKFQKELSPDARIVTNLFTFPKLHLVRHDAQDKLSLYKTKP